jgi:tRNA-dihydrouridine synthase
MIGRGGVRNPALFREIKGGSKITAREVTEFSHLLIENYRKALGSNTFTLHKLKEIWVHMITLFPEDKKISKAIKKAKSLDDFTSAIACLPKEF